MGRVDEARAHAREGSALSHVAGDEIFWRQLEGVLGFVELSLGNLAEADRHLRPLWPALVAMGFGEPARWPVLPNEIEALVGLGELEAAEEFLIELEECGRALDSPWALSQAARCRGLLLAARGRPVDALPQFETALDVHRRMPGGFERARTLLAQGRTLRRMKRRREARAALEAALAVFEDLGTPLWAEQTREALARIGGRAPAGDALTPTEQRVAALVAEGRSNREAAAELFVSVRTVEANLTRIYAKLGVRSRAELARRGGASEPLRRPSP
jgi:DNA-binding CsgD family transcriptional regulator